ncbi:FAD-dependent monooxygenase [Burkholderiaceae bacterium UC74_6]
MRDFHNLDTPQTPQTPQTSQVLIAGAGPVGLFLACELRLAGVAVTVLEQTESPASPLKRLPLGLRGLSIPTLETFQRRGLLDAITGPQASAATPGAHWMQQQRRPGGHFAGIQFFEDQVDPSRWPWRLPDAICRSVAVNMEHIETVLAARALELGAVIRRGCGVKSFEVSDGGDTITVQAGGEAFRGQWLVGCDGGRSTVRKLGGFEFIGTEPEFTGYSALLDLADPEALPAGRHYTGAGMYTFQRPGTAAMVDFDGGAFHRSQPVTVEHVQAVLRRVSGVDVTVTALHHATTWTDRAHQATRYRRGRVLLAGDAAHIHSPLGGQGLNLGLGDAMNVGWKLAAVVRCEAPESLLDSYEAERMPVGAQVLDWSRAQVSLMRPSPSSRAMASVIRDLVETGDGATYFAERVLGATLRYDLGGNSHPLVGRSVPHFALKDGTRLADQLRAGKGVLLDLSMAEDDLGLSAVLVRADGVVAWAADLGVADEEGLEQALAQWFSMVPPAGIEPTFAA